MGPRQAELMDWLKDRDDATVREMADGLEWGMGQTYQVVTGLEASRLVKRLTRKPTLPGVAAGAKRYKVA